MKKLIIIALMLFGTLATAEPLTKNHAEIICRDYYKDLYTSHTGLKARSSIWKHVVHIMDNGDVWSVAVQGEVQNYYGTWVEVLATCQVHKEMITPQWLDYRNIEHFQYITE